MAEEDPLFSQGTPRVGVILCECGAMVSDRVDLDELARQAATLPGVVYTHHEALPLQQGWTGTPAARRART